MDHDTLLDPTAPEATAPEATAPERGADEDGFTFIELMVVLLIMLALMAIAVPTYLGARNHANNRSAQTELTEATSAAETVYQSGQTYAVTGGATTMAADLGKSTPNLTFTTSASTKNNVISVSVGGTAGEPGSWIAMVTYAADGKCWGVFIPDNQKELYSKVTESPSACIAPTTAPTKGAGGWVTGSFPVGT